VLALKQEGFPYMLLKRYHFVMFKDAHGQSRKFCLRGYSLVLLSLLFLGMVTGNVYFWKFYATHHLLNRELNRSEKIIQEQKIQLLSFTNKLREVEKDLSRIRDFNTKLRVMINMDHTRMDEVTALGGAENQEFSEGYLPLYRQELLARKMHSFLEQLRTDARMEEVRQQDLISAINARRDLLAATPSIWPTKGWISSSFGYRTSPFTGRREFHKGLDISGPIGTPVYAPANGTVTFSGTDGGYGICIVLNHGNGITTRYAHMHRTSVKVGQTVTRGELIGLMGNTGRSTGPHLHYEVRLNGVFVNPERFILN
jgi:murein DD-endopeptidase MepM/ murein hydrolase activator NlpD